MAQRTSFAWSVKPGRGVKLHAPIFVVARSSEGPTIAEFDMGKLSDTMLQKFFEHGRSKLHDAAALNAGASESEKVAAMRAVYETLVAGEWNAKRETLTPEQRAAVLRERVVAAWVSLDAGNRNAAKFDTMVNSRISELRNLGNSGVTSDVIVAALSKNAKIIAAIAALAGNGNQELVEGLV